MNKLVTRVILLKNVWHCKNKLPNFNTNLFYYGNQTAEHLSKCYTMFANEINNPDYKTNCFCRLLLENDLAVSHHFLWDFID